MKPQLSPRLSSFLRRCPTFLFPRLHRRRRVSGFRIWKSNHSGGKEEEIELQSYTFPSAFSASESRFSFISNFSSPFPSRSVDPSQVCNPNPSILLCVCNCMRCCSSAAGQGRGVEPMVIDGSMVVLRCFNCQSIWLISPSTCFLEV